MFTQSHIMTESRRSSVLKKSLRERTLQLGMNNVYHLFLYVFEEYFSCIVLIHDHSVDCNMLNPIPQLMAAHMYLMNLVIYSFVV